LPSVGISTTYTGVFVEIVIDRTFSKGCAKNEDRVINDGIDGFSRFTLGSSRLLSFFAIRESKVQPDRHVRRLGVGLLYFLFV